jgi:hypothetical protein
MFIFEQMSDSRQQRCAFLFKYCLYAATLCRPTASLEPIKPEKGAPSSIRLERLPTTWNHVIDKEKLKSNRWSMLESKKASNFFKDML